MKQMKMERTSLNEPAGHRPESNHSSAPRHLMNAIVTPSCLSSGSTGPLYRLTRVVVATLVVCWMAFWSQPVEAHTSEEILSTAVTNYTGYVINSDGNFPSEVYNRDEIRVSAQVRYQTASFTVSNFEYQLQYRLVDSHSNAVPLRVGLTTSPYIILSDDVTLPFFVLGTPVQIATRTYAAALRPAQQLNPNEQYRVELKLYERPGGSNLRFDFTDDVANTTGATYYHFTNTVSGDAALNVFATLESETFTRAYAVKTIPAKNSFSVGATYRLRRYDDFYAQPANGTVAVHLNYQLIDAATGEVIPLVTTNKVVNRSIASFVLGTPYAPATLLATDTLDMEPAAGIQLDSVNKTYLARVTISHVDQAGQAPLAGNTLETPAQRLLHFNGNLYFGTVQTVFTSIDNVPPVGLVVPNSHVTSQLGVNNNSGYVFGHPSHTYGDGTDLNVRLASNGNATLMSGTVSVNEPAPDKDTISNLRFERQNVVLDTSGAHADVILTLPTGFGYRSDTLSRRLNSKITWAAIPLNQQLAPLNDLNYTTPHFACEETKPFWVGSSALRWQIAGGRLLLTPTSIQYVRRDELINLEAAPGLVEADMRRKRSNEQYHRYLQAITSSQVTVLADAGGNARMSLDATLAPGEFTAHFPYDAPVKWLGNGQLKFVADQVVPTNSYLTAVQTVTNRYDQDCPGCGPGKGQTNLNFIPTANQLSFTIDGGLEGAGIISAARPLNWGWIASPAIQKYAQRTTAWSAGNFLAAGCFLRGDQSAMPTIDRAGVLLLSGALPADLTQVERPGTPDYLKGFADYAGLNFRVGTDGAMQAESVLAGKATGLYNLTGRSKYYARWSGVSGIHEAVPGSFPSQLTLYGYDFTFSNYGLSYLSSQNEESRTEGHVHIKSPSNFDQNFKELMFSCVGALESAKVPSDEAGLYKLLEYWNGDFITLGIKFDRDESVACDPSIGYLVLGVQGHATYVPEPIFGSLGFKSNGNLVSGKDVSSGEIKLAAGFNSRLKVPNNFQIEGAAPGEHYTLNPATDAYYSDWENRDPNASQGYVNLAADLDVPFFENIKTHVHTSGKTNSPAAPIYLMGGWPNHGYGTAADNFFTNPLFDEDNTGYPTADGLLKYRNNTETEKYHPRAQTSWLGVIDLDYPLEWSTTVRWFGSWQPVTTDILVLSTEHKVKYLSSQDVELLFGAKVDTAPYLNIPSLNFRIFDEHLGVYEAFESAGFQTNRYYMEKGFKSMDTLLRADPRDFLAGPFLSQLYEIANDLHGQVISNPSIWDWYIDDYFDPNTGTLIEQMRKMDVAQFGVIDDVKYRIEDAIKGIDMVRDLIKKDPDGNRRAAAVLVGEVLRKLDPSLAETLMDLLGGTLNEQFEPYLASYGSSLDQIDVTLALIKTQLAAVRASLEPGQSFYQEIHELFLQHDAALQAASAKVHQDMTLYFNALDSAYDIQDVYAADFIGFVRQKMEDRFIATPLAAALQVALKQRLYDLDGAMREACNTEFGLFNHCIRTVTGEVLAFLDQKLRGLLGKVGSVASAAQINGYAHINGDSLKLLRLDLAAQLQMPDAMEFKAYFQIKELDSEGTATECLPASGRATEVTMGAIDIPCSFWGGTNNSLKATVNAKFTFDPGPEANPYPFPLLVTLGGSLELKGSLKFGTLEILYIGAGMAFGELENYFTAAAKVRQGGYEGSGGIFIGRTCTLGFLFWDPDVTAVLGDQLPFTGVYLYGEAWIPIAEVILGIPSSCMFDVSAGVGAGMGMFIEGPTFVAKMKMGVSGSVLCLLTIKGEVALAGKVNPDGIALAGRGTLSGVVGPCPVCLDFSKDIFMTYENYSWDVDF
jgi:hypothetical protein